MIRYYKFNRPSGHDTGWVKVKTRKNSRFCWFCDIYDAKTGVGKNKLREFTKWTREHIEFQLKELKAEEIPKEEFIKAVIQYGR